MPEKFTYQSAAGMQREAVCWPVENPKGIVQLVHGMCEHIGRYEATAEALNQHGYTVVGHNHPGHGADAALLGYFAEQDGWDVLLRDIQTVREETQKCYPNMPYFLLGHSMGSFAARCYALKWEKGLQGLVLSGTGHFDKATLSGGLTIARLQKAFGMDRKQAKLIDNIAGGNRNKTYADVRTPFDWLSRDRERVQSYVDDPLCGFLFTVNGYRNMFEGLTRLYPQCLGVMEPDVPVYLMSGADDPVGDYGVGVKLVADEIRNAGVKDVTMKLYPEGRHEMFNELNRREAWSDLCAWLDSKL